METSSCAYEFVLSAYSTLVSLAFMVVTVLYSTHGSLECSDTVNGDNSKVKRLVHVDFLNMDKSLNGDDITDQVVDAWSTVIADRKHYSVCSRLWFLCRYLWVSAT